MPIPKPESGELEKDYISRCISDIASEYDAEGQAYAVCKGEFDKSTEMSLQTEEEIKALPEPKSSEGREQYIRRCVPTIYKEGGKYDQRVATSMCADRYEKSTALSNRKSRVQFSENKWASILNETDPLVEHNPTAMNSFSDIMNEGMEEIRMTSADARGFGSMRQNMKEALGVAPTAPKIMEDPETGKTFEVPIEVQQAMTRDYSALMKAMNKKKGS